jgi:hypothetical protein
MKWAENEKRISQFVKWARVEASSLSGQKFGLFMKRAISQMECNIYNEYDFCINIFKFMLILTFSSDVYNVIL